MLRPSPARPRSLSPPSKCSDTGANPFACTLAVFSINPSTIENRTPDLKVGMLAPALTTR